MTNSHISKNVEVLIVGASLGGAACAKRTTDAGFETIILERKALPRHKLCSGILSPRGYRFLLENFGPLPKDACHSPVHCRGVVFYFPGMLSMPMDFSAGPTPHLYRKYSDYWAIKQSGAEVADSTEFIGLENKEGHVEVTAKKKGEVVTYRAKYVIGADGPLSAVRHSVYPEYAKQIPWFVVGQKLHEIIECPLDAEYFHFWFHPDLGHYTWSHARDGRQIVGVGFPAGELFEQRQERVVKYLKEKYNVKLGACDNAEICTANFGPSLINRYIFGKGKVLITGQAAGFLNMIAEGMSCALHSGAIAGESVVEAVRCNRKVQEVYRKMIASEVQRCTDQWNPGKIAFAHPHEADFREALRKHLAKDRILIIKELLSFLRIYSRFNWGRQIIWQSFLKQLTGSYSQTGWL